METAVTEKRFDLSDQYKAVLNQGIRLFGENMLYFVEDRLKIHQAHLSSRPSRILDSGCGIGNASKRLGKTYPDAPVPGIDTSEAALHAARRLQEEDRLHFLTLGAFAGETVPHDLCYVNGVFHLIPVAGRPKEPGTRIVSGSRR